MTKKKTAVAAALILIAGAVIYILRPKGSTDPLKNDSIPATSNKQRNEGSKHRAERVISSPRTKASVNVTPSEAPEACLTMWQGLGALDLTGFTDNDTLIQNLPKPNDCEQLPDDLRDAHMTYASTCKGVRDFLARADERVPESDKRRARHDCYIAIVSYRALLAHRQTLDLKPEDITDPKLLSDKIIALLQSEPTKITPYAERLLALEPDFYPAAQSIVVSTFLSNIDARELDIETIEKDLDRFKDFPGLNEQLLADVYATSLVKKYKEHPDSEAMTKAFDARFPNMASGDYLKAWAAYTGGDVASARQYVDTALRKDPNNQTFLTTKQILSDISAGRKNTSQEEVFSSQLHLDVDALIQ